MLPTRLGLMPKNIDDDFDALDIDELPEDFENIEIRQILANNQIAARQRLE